MTNTETGYTEMGNSAAFTSNREVILAITEVTQDNLWRFSVKLMRTLKEGIITTDQMGGHIECFTRHCKAEKINMNYPS